MGKQMATPRQALILTELRRETLARQASEDSLCGLEARAGKCDEKSSAAGGKRALRAARRMYKTRDGQAVASFRRAISESIITMSDSKQFVYEFAQYYSTDVDLSL